MYWSPDQTRLLLIDTPEVFQDGDYSFEATLSLWNPATGDVQPLLTDVKGAVQNNVSGLAWSPDQTGLAVVLLDHLIVFDLATGQTVLDVSYNFEQFDTPLAWSPAGSQLAVSGKNETSIWNATTGEITRTLPIHADALAWMDSGLFTYASRQPLTQWDVETGTSAEIPFPDMMRIAWSEDGRYLAGTMDAEIVLIDLANNNEIARLDNTEAPVSLSWVGDDTLVTAVGSTLCVWSIPEGTLLYEVTPYDIGPRKAKKPHGYPDSRLRSVAEHRVERVTELLVVVANQKANGWVALVELPVPVWRKNSIRAPFSP